MEELINFCESEAACLDMLCGEQYSTISHSGYTSVIKFDGWPILPPVMTQQRRQEMLLYKQQAAMVESRIKARIRQQLLAKVDSVIQQISAKEKTISQSDPMDDSKIDHTCLKNDTDTRFQDENEIQPIDTLNLSYNNDQEGEPCAEEKASHVANGVNTLSPRTCTKDSGVFSKCHTAVESTDAQSLEQLSEAEADDKLDTMADVVDLSSEGPTASEDAPSESTTLERRMSSVSDGSKKTSSTSTEGHVSYDSQESSRNTDVKDISSEKGSLESAPPVASISSCSNENAQEMQTSKETDDKLPPLGSRERVEMLVKKLDSALKYHERQRTPASMIMSLPSTNSSATTTFSSDEMNQTVIGREDISVEQQLNNSDTRNSADEDQSLHESAMPRGKMAASGEVTMPEDSSPEGQEDDATIKNHEEVLSVSNSVMCSLNSSLLSRVVLETPEETSEDISDPDGSHSVKESVVQEADVPASNDDASQSLPSPGPMHTPDLSAISNVTEDSKDACQSPISAALKLGGTVHRLKYSADNINSEVVFNPSTDSQANNSKEEKFYSTSEPCLHSEGTSQMYTESTELAQYMDNTMDTMPSSISTLPFHHENSQKSSATGSPENGLQPIRSQPSEKVEPKREPALERVRRNSYVLEHPSPMLVAAYGEQSKKSPSEAAALCTYSSESHHSSRPVSLTSSMEELKLKPVQRKLDYSTTTTTATTTSADPLKPILKKTTPPSADDNPVCSLAEMDSRMGKEEHLNRYLQQLSQMPNYDGLQNSMVQSFASVPNMPAAYGTHSYVQPLNPVPQMVSFPTDLATLGHLSQEQLVQLQMQYFEMMRQQLMEQQQQQLALLFAEQERQQMLLQQELLQQQQLMQSDPLILQRKHQLQQTNAELKNCIMTASRQPGAEMNGDIVSKVPNGEPVLRQTMVPLARVSFAPSPQPKSHSSSKSPSGVYCNQDFPLSSHNGSVLDKSVENTVQQQSDSVYRSPAVLRHSALEQLVDNQKYSIDTSQMYAGGIYLPEYVSLPESTVRQSNENLPPSLQRKFEKLSALAKGFLVRQLMKTNKVQHLIKIIKDTAEFALLFQQETPIKKGIFSQQDRVLHERVLAQLTAAMYEIHEIFFEISVKERMAIIRQSRIMEQERLFRQKYVSQIKSKGISTASKKAMERKRKAKAAEAILFGHVRPKSCPPSTSSPKNARVQDLSGPIRRNYQFLMLRALKPIQAQLSPIKPNKDTDLASSVGSNEVKMKPSPRSKHGAPTVKRIQSKHKSITGKPMGKMNTALSIQKASRISNQSNKSSPCDGKSPQVKAGSKSESGRNEPQASNGTTSKSEQKTTNQTKVKRTSTMLSGSQAPKSESSTKGSQMVRHTSQTNKARMIKADAAQNMIKRIMSQAKPAVEK